MLVSEWVALAKKVGKEKEVSGERGKEKTRDRH